MCVCVCERGKDKHTYLIHSQRHTYAVLFHQHGGGAERTACVELVYHSCLGCIVDRLRQAAAVTLFFFCFADVSKLLSLVQSSLSMSICRFLTYSLPRSFQLCPCCVVSLPQLIFETRLSNGCLCLLFLLLLLFFPSPAFCCPFQLDVFSHLASVCFHSPQ